MEKPAVRQGKVDTGAMVSCMPLSVLHSLGLSERHLKQSNVTLYGFSGTDLENLGCLDITVTCNRMKDKARFYVTTAGREILLGVRFCKKFKLVDYAPSCILSEVKAEPSSQPSSGTNNLNAVHILDETEVDYNKLHTKWKAHLPLGKKTGDALEDLKRIFPTMFDGNVGQFQGEATLQLSPDAKPVQLAPRAIPQSILPQLKKELDRMEQEGIIRPCPETTEWVHNIVTVVKKNGTLRLCLDPRNLNKHLIRNVHYTASWEDAQHSFRNGQYFSTLDAKSGYWTKLLDKQSQLLTAFNTPFKKYCFVRLPFGLSVSAEIFCEHMDRALDGIPGTFPCADDVKVQGSTEERHDIHLLETVSRAQKAGLKFNPDKCQIKQRQVEYFGRIITPQGIKPCPTKVEAITRLTAPTDKQELQSFLGTVTFMSTFIPNLSKKTHLMRGLLKRDVHYTWTSDMQKDFETIKADIASATTLVHYDPNKPAIIETDASLKGLGAVLIQDGRPVRYISKSLTPAETDYANIERELLAVLFACEKLHNYTFGRTITIHTDHKPLESIIQKPISLAPARLQRMLLRLAKYNLEIKYVGAKSVLLADTLSRLIPSGKDKQIRGLDVTIAQVLKIATTRMESLQGETAADPTLQLLSEYIRSGWPNSMQDLPQDLKDFWCFRDELAILDGLIMKGNRVIIPSTARKGTLERLHDAHQGITSTLQRARRTVYWPRMQDDITQMVNSCEECQIHANKKHRPPERQVSASRPSQMLGIDLMELNGKSALITIDFYSGYITYDPLPNESTEAVIEALHLNFQKLGIVEEIYSDNGPCFKSSRFAQFCEELQVAHRTSSPHYHQSMGRVERAVQTVKQILKKSKTALDVTRAISTYHDTPISDTLPSPAELFFGRRINTRLGLMLKPSIMTDSQRLELAERRSAHLKEPQRTKDDYVPGQPIWYTEDGNSEWRHGTVESRDPHPGSYWIISGTTNRRVRRSKHDLKPRYPPTTATPTNREPPPAATPMHVMDTPPDTLHEHVPTIDPGAAPTDRTQHQQTESTVPPTTRYGRVIRDNKHPDYIY
jgi:transposase InsO family protein